MKDQLLQPLIEGSADGVLFSGRFSAFCGGVSIFFNVGIVEIKPDDLPPRLPRAPVLEQPALPCTRAATYAPLESDSAPCG